MPHCRVLPFREFNGTMPQPLHFLFRKFHNDSCNCFWQCCTENKNTVTCPNTTYLMLCGLLYSLLSNLLYVAALLQTVVDLSIASWNPNSIPLICCKSPQHLDTPRCCGFVVHISICCGFTGGLSHCCGFVLDFKDLLWFCCTLAVQQIHNKIE